MMATAFAALALVAPAESPTRWESAVHADGGVRFDGGYLYGDTILPSGGMVNSSVVLDDGTILTDVLPSGPDGRWYWIGDARQASDGRLMVVASELGRAGNGTDMWDFRGVDTDVFMVRDPGNVMSWRFAEHVDAGWWDDLNVRFVDNTYAAVTDRDGSNVTYLLDATTGERWPLFDKGSDGVVAPVFHDGYWWAMSWSTHMGAAALWRTPELVAEPWEWVEGWDAAGTYLHNIDVIDGELVRYWSTVGGRVTYEILRTHGTPGVLS